MKYKASRKIIVMASIVFCAVFMFTVAVPTVLAVDIPVYQQLENIPGADAKSTNFLDYVHSIYRLSLWIVGISAMFMISVGGFMYLTSAGNTSSAASAKGVIKDALIGLLLGLSAWLLLNTINPDLTKLDVQSLATSPTGEATPSTPSVPLGIKGNCGGMGISIKKSQCDLVSPELNSIMACMSQKGKVGPVTSITSDQVGGDLAKSAACCGDPNCTHSTYACHYGCTENSKKVRNGVPLNEKGYSHSIDYSAPASSTDAMLCAIADAAWECGAGSNIWGRATIKCSKGTITKQEGHGTHLHIPTKECNG